MAVPKCRGTGRGHGGTVSGRRSQIVVQPGFGIRHGSRHGPCCYRRRYRRDRRISELLIVIVADVGKGGVEEEDDEKEKKEDVEKRKTQTKTKRTIDLIMPCL